MEVALRRGLSREEREGLTLALRDQSMKELKELKTPANVGAEGRP